MMSVSAQKAAVADLTSKCKHLDGIDRRMKRLHGAVAVNEKRIHELIETAAQCAARYEHCRLADSLKAVENLRRHNSKLFAVIGRTETKLAAIAEHVAKEAREVMDEVLAQVRRRVHQE